MLHGEGKGLTPFNFVPLIAASQARRLICLAAVPFHIFRFSGEDFHESGETSPLDIAFFNDEGVLLAQPQITARPVILWTDRESSFPLIRSFLLQVPCGMLVLSEDESLLRKAEASITSDDVPIIFQHVAPDLGSSTPPSDSSRLIWRAFLRLLAQLKKRFGAPDAGQRMAPEFQTPVTFKREIEATAFHSLCPWTEQVANELIPWDFVAAPNKILLNNMKYKLGVWNGGPLPADEAHNSAVEDARYALRLRGLTNLLQGIASLEDRPKNASMVMWDSVRKELPVRVREMIERLIRAPKTVAARAPLIAELFSSSPDSIRAFAPHQIILLCPSATLAVAGARQRIADVDDAAESWAALKTREPDYWQHVFAQASLSGRRVDVLHPENPDQKMIFGTVLQTIQVESQHLSALGILYATRFGSPLLKLDRFGTEVFEPYLDVHRTFESGDFDARTVQLKIEALGAHCTKLFPAPYLTLLRERDDSLVHAFADVPLEFTHVGDEFLGYFSQLSRTPLTPGVIPLLNYNLTEHTVALPTQPESFLLVTPFDEDDPTLRKVLNALEVGGVSVPIRVIRRRSELQHVLENSEVRCLLYLGHGFHDIANDEGGLVLQDHNFRPSDVAAASRVPSLIVLIGCDTAPAVSAFGGMHLAFLKAGAAMVVGTSFPVPRKIAGDFLQSFIRLLLSNGTRDVAEAVAVARWQIRVEAELFSFRELELLTPTEERSIRADLQNTMWVLRSVQHDRARIIHQAFRQILTDHGVIPSLFAKPWDWGIIPYSLFFSVLGFPWTSRNPNWTKQYATNCRSQAK